MEKESIITGEEKSRTSIFQFCNLTIKIKYYGRSPAVLESTGSFHYLMNKGKHNANNLTFHKMQEFLLEFGKTIGICLENLQLLPPEFAQIIVIPFDIEQVVENTFYEKRKKFIDNAPGEPSRISGKPSNDYRLKIYSKHHEHPEHYSPNTLRLEYQAKKIRALRKLGIRTIKDLVIRKNWIKIKNLHSSLFSHMVLFDYSIKLPRESTYKNKVTNYSNQNWWQKQIRDIKNGKAYSTKYNDEVEFLNKLSKKYGSDMLCSILYLSEKQWITSLGLCQNISEFQITKPKQAPGRKQKQAPFIECTPCYVEKSMILR